MPNYVWTAKAPSGHEVVEEIEADTAEDAKYILLARGFTDLALKEDDVMAAVQAGFKSSTTTFLGKEIKPTAAERLRARDNPPVTFMSNIMSGIEQSKGLFLIILLFAIYDGYRGHWISVLLLALGALLWLAFFLFLGAPLVYYTRLIQAVDWYRWNEVLSLTETVKTAGSFSITKVPETELIRNRAKALTGLGRLDEGLAELKKCEGRPDCPGWMYKLSIASLYTLAKQYDQGIAFNRMALDENPNSTAWLDLANRYARYKYDPVKARDALAEAEKSPLPDLAKPYQIRCRGIIAYLEGDYETARRELETSIQLLDAAKKRPFRDGHLSVSRAYLCCVLAKQGDLPAAKACFDQAREYLVATKEDELIAECRQLIQA